MCLRAGATLDPVSEVDADGLEGLPTALVAGRYRIVRRIGRGGMGTVYEAEHVAIGRRVALKLLAERYAKDPIVRARFEREARATTTIAQPHVVEVLDMGITEDGQPFIVLELLEGETLGEHLAREGRLEPAEAAWVGFQVFSALAVAHARGVVHRDLKPDNVYLQTRAGDARYVKLLDFGVSKLLNEPLDLDLTQTGSVMGTPRYMSPEQARGQHDLDHRIDVFTAGILLYEMLSGRTPYQGDSYNAMLAALLEQTPPALRDIAPEVPPELAELVTRAMAKDREERPAVSEALAVLRRFAAPARIAAEPDLPVPPAPAPRLGRTLPTPTPSPDAPTEMIFTTAPSGPRPMPPAPAPGVAVAARAPRRPLRWVLALGVLAAAAGGFFVLRSRGAPRPAAVLSGPPLRFGVVRWLPVATMERDAAPFLRYLEGKLGRPVSLAVMENVEEAERRLLGGELDLLRLTPLAFVRIAARVPGLEVLATYLSDGARTYQGVILARMGKGIATLEETRGKTFCFSSRTSTSGYLFPRALLRQRGLDPERDFAATRLTGDHLASMRGVRDGQCDVAAVDSTAFLNAREEGISPGAFQVIASTEAIPLDPFVATAQLPAEERKRVRSALLEAAPGTPAAGAFKSAFVRIDGFVPAADSDYDGVRRVDRLSAGR